MAHEIQIENGQARAFFTREPAWHRLGTVLENPPTSEEAIRLMNADWNVETAPVCTIDGQEIEDYKAIRRKDTQEIFAILSSGYQVVQNREAFAFFDPLVKQGIASFETGAMLHGGKQLFLMAKLKDTFAIGGKDEILPYILLSMAHDGTRAVNARYTPIRVVCANTLALALNTRGQHEISIRHFGNMEEKMKEAQRAIVYAAQSAKAAKEAFEHLARIKLSTAEMNEYFESLYPDPEEGNEEPMRKKRAALMQLSETGLGMNLDTAKGTAWGAYNAVVELVDYGMPTDLKGAQKQADDLLESAMKMGAARRTNNQLFGAGFQMKKRAMVAALSLG